jgi:hypothetical protein
MDEKLAHDGDEGDLVGFAFGDEALINGLEEGIAAGGGERRHVKGGAHAQAPAAAAAPAAKGATVAVEGSQPGQGGHFVFGEGAEGRAAKRAVAVSKPTPSTATNRSTLRRSAGVVFTRSLIQASIFLISRASQRRWARTEAPIRGQRACSSRLVSAVCSPNIGAEVDRSTTHG